MHLVDLYSVEFWRQEIHSISMMDAGDSYLNAAV